MFLSRRIRHADFEEYPGQVHTSGPDLRLGKVTVVYSNARRPEFENILREEYFHWKDNHKFDWRRGVPTGVQTLPPKLHKDASDYALETEEENERLELEEQARRVNRQSRFDAANLALLARMGEAAFEKQHGKVWLDKLKALRDAAKEPTA